jgi:hypothetical protein
MDLKAVLSVQRHLASFEKSVNAAEGVRKRLSVPYYQIAYDLKI